jgi:hypothetical protein
MIKSGQRQPCVNYSLTIQSTQTQHPNTVLSFVIIFFYIILSLQKIDGEALLIAGKAIGIEKSCSINRTYVYVLSSECRKTRENIGTKWEIWKRDSLQRFWRGGKKSMSHARGVTVWTWNNLATVRFIILYLLICPIKSKNKTKRNKSKLWQFWYWLSTFTQYSTTEWDYSRIVCWEEYWHLCGK